MSTVTADVKSPAPGASSVASSAKIRYLRVSPQKARLVVDLVRGKQVEQALAILRFSRKAVAKDLYKVLWAAIANAKEKEGLRDESNLFVHLAYVDPGPTLKRIRANSMGRAFRILHRTSHITFVLGKREPKARPPAAVAAGSRTRKPVAKTSAAKP